MLGVSVVEVPAGLLVLARLRIGGYVIAFWLNKQSFVGFFTC
jgi:hypothetical protein